MKNEGSALIITLLVITILAGLAFAASRLTFTELKQSVRLEDSEIAYQAAESGIELGLLLYRYNKNIELPENVSRNNEYYRFNISDGLVMGMNETMESDKSYFDLQILTKNQGSTEEVNFIECDDDMIIDENINCEYDDSDGYIIPALEKDHVVEYDVSGNESIDIGGNFIKDDPDDLTGILLFIPIDAAGLVLLGNKEMWPSVEFTEGMNVNISEATILRLKPLEASVKNYTITDTEGNLMDSRYTKIISTGYYGSSKRKLDVKIDNATGSLSTPFDFLIISGK